jgi:hypothetical protein
MDGFATVVLIDIRNDVPNEDVAVVPPCDGTMGRDDGPTLVGIVSGSLGNILMLGVTDVCGGVCFGELPVTKRYTPPSTYENI